MKNVCIYVVTKGAYETYEILAVTTKKEKAERMKQIFQKRYGDRELINIEEFIDESEDLGMFWRILYFWWVNHSDNQKGT